MEQEKEYCVSFVNFMIMGVVVTLPKGAYNSIDPGSIKVISSYRQFKDSAQRMFEFI